MIIPFRIGGRKNPTHSSNEWGTRNLDAEAKYIAVDDPVAAGRIVLRILRAVDLLKKNPALGRAGRVAGTRELVVAGTPYIVPYRVRGEAVEVLRVFHAARKWPAKL